MKDASWHSARFLGDAEAIRCQGLHGLRRWPSVQQALERPERTRMETVYLPLQMAPTNLTQPILPNWSFNLFNVNMGASSNAAIEQEALQTVGSYGKQIGHLAEALEVIIGKLDLLGSNDLSVQEKDALRIFLGDVAAIRKIKRSHE